MADDIHGPEVSERQVHTEATYTHLFGPPDIDAPDNDPELLRILWQ